MVEHRVGYQLKRAQHAFRLQMDSALAEIGLTTPQYAVLAALQEEPGLSGAHLARRCFVTPQTMNPILTALAKAGLIGRTAHPEHGRVVQTFLTDEGQGRLVEAHRRVAAVEAVMVGNLSPEERQQLAGLLRSCADALTGGE